VDVKRIFVPTSGPLDWKRLLAKPERHWKAGHSAMALAQCWEEAHPGLPAEVAAALTMCLGELDLLLALPEYKVELEGGDRPSQTDLMVFARSRNGLVCIAVEGKVDEPFGPALGEKRRECSDGVEKRLEQLHRVLGLSSPLPDDVYYQLVHRTASALITAEKFGAVAAVMLVHSFSKKDSWFPEFDRFAKLLGAAPERGRAARAQTATSLPLFLGWCHGEERFLEEQAHGQD